MTLQEQIRLAVRAMVKNMVVVTNHVVEVTAVRESDGFLDVKSETGLEYFDVLISLDGDNGVNLIPTVGCKAIIGVIESKETYCYLIDASEVDSISLKTKNGMVIRIDTGGTITINGDGHKGIVKVEADVKAHNKVEDDINQLKQLITGWAPTPQDGGAALKTALSTWAGQTLVKTTVADLENPKVKHG